MILSDVGTLSGTLGLVVAEPTLYRGLGKQGYAQRKVLEVLKSLKTTQYKNLLKEQIVFGLKKSLG